MLESLLTNRKDDAKGFRLHTGEDGYERIVFAEVMIPEYLNTFNDYHSARSVREFAYAYMINGFSIDVEHSNNDISGKAYVVESFVARKGDPDFIEEAWVMGMYIKDDELWEQIKEHEINGFSYEAIVDVVKIDIDMPLIQTVTGVTEEDPIDKHVHDFFVLLDDDGRIISGGTTEANGHAHEIVRHTFTGEASGHVHIFNYIDRTGEE